MTLLARAPVNISFCGDGESSVHCEGCDGLTISAAINYYTYTILTPGWSGGLQIISADHHDSSWTSCDDEPDWESSLCLPRAIARYFNLSDGLTIFLASQIPPGAGLGSPGSLAVSMIKAVAFWCGLDLGPAEVAELACYIEIEKLGMPAGKQDQYAAAFGGLNCITSSPSGVTLEQLQLSTGTYQALEKGLMLFSAADHDLPVAAPRRRSQSDWGAEIRRALEQGDLDAFGGLLHRSWTIDGVADLFWEQCYRAARENGALGGNVTGAFLMLYCPLGYQNGVMEALEALGLRRLPFVLENRGVEVMQAMPWSRPYTPNPLSFVSENSEIDMCVAPSLS